MKKRILLSFVIGLLITSLIWVCRNPLSANVPLGLFNAMGILGAPGTLITIIIAGVIAPDDLWQATHVTGLYRYLSYAANFLFYSLCAFFIQLLIARRRKSSSVKS